METKLEQRIVWESEFATGVSMIDDQHRILISLLNDANSKLTDCSTLGDFSRTVNALLSYSDYHFGTEERFVIEHGYDLEMESDAAEHIAQHRAFVEKMVEIQAQIKAGQRIPKVDLVGFLQDWLSNHILNTDKKLGQFICDKKANKLRNQADQA